MKNREKESKQVENGGRLIHVTDADFNIVLQKSPAVLIDFYATWCGPCKSIAPKIVELSEKYAGRVVIGKIDIDENPKTADRFDVDSIPTLLLLKNGKEIDRIVGSVPMSTIEKAIERAFNLKLQGGKKIVKTET